MNVPKCKDSRPCFARSAEGWCIALDDVYMDGDCPFYKSPEQWDRELRRNRYRGRQWRR